MYNKMIYYYNTPLQNISILKIVYFVTGKIES